MLVNGMSVSRCRRKNSSRAIWQERRRYVREGRIKQPHPWRVALSEGKVSRRALIEYVKNRYYFLANINRKDAQVIANCPISDARRMLLRKYIDEEGQDVAGGQLGPHYEMWLKVSDALGIPRDCDAQLRRRVAGLSLHSGRCFQLRQTSNLARRASPPPMRPKGACGNATRQRRSTKKRVY